jgi:WhiB family transcriptional regulator, redox-sensing transcriptional regulator
MQTPSPRPPASTHALAAIIPGLEEPARRTAVLAVWEQALCAQVDPELFFPEKGQPSRKALAVCAACPVRETCREVFGPLLPVGVVGGTTAMARRGDRARRRTGEAA